MVRFVDNSGKHVSRFAPPPLIGPARPTTALGHMRAAWAAYRASWSVYVLSMLALVASWVILELAVFATSQLGIVPWLVLHATFFLVFSGLLVGVHRMALEAVDGAAPRLGSLAGLLERGPSLLLASALYTAGVAGGLLLFVAPGAYLAVRWSFFGQAIAARGASAPEALRRSAALTRGRGWQAFRLQLLLLALNVAGAALLGIGMLVSFPVSLLAAASFYRAAETADRT